MVARQIGIKVFSDEFVLGCTATMPNAKTEDVTGPTVAMKAACTAVLAQFTAAHVLTRKTGSYAAAALTGFMQVGMWGVGHNFMHQSEKKCGLWRYVMDVNATHSADWQISHGLSHHLDTNLDTDFEQEFFLMSFKDPERTGLIAPLAPALAPLVNLAGSVEYTISTAKEASAEVKGGRTWAQVLPGLLPLLQIISYARGTGSWRRALGLYATQAAAYQLPFSPCAAGVHHSVPASGSSEEDLVKGSSAPRPTVAWIEGQEGREKDWGAHQVAATSTHTIYPQSMPAFLRDYLSLTCFGYLNNHALHHIFPAVDASRLLGCYDLLEETAREFGLPEKNTHQWHWTTIGMGWWRYMLQRQVREAKL